MRNASSPCYARPLKDKVAKWIQNGEQRTKRGPPRGGGGKEATAQLSSLDTQVPVVGSEYDCATGMYKAPVPEDLACEVCIWTHGQH